jgi:hypothetical protein
MLHSIIQKIQSEFEKGLTTEAQILYVIVQIRKSLEHGIIQLTNDKPLKFYCDWAVHTSMHKAAAQEVLKKLEPIYAFLASHPNMDGIPEEVDRKIRAYMSFDLFRSSLDEYFQQAGLTNAITASVPHWYAFLGFYFRIVEDCPLQLKQDNPNSLLKKAVLKVSHDRSTHVPGGQKYSYTLQWKMLGQDGKVEVLNNHFVLDPAYPPA